ncbi:MAG: NADH-quinone oxidoreductase subunit NuoH [Planctomycetes bacterium]|nr:NADH-quinone oxidoreductase subunit NuoH [Planctomycetota bacterium]
MNEHLRALLLAVVVVNTVLALTTFAIWFERKFAGRMQSRLGPTRVGPFGLLQPVADAFKLMQKESIRPRQADRVLFELAPLLGATCALGAAAVVPLAPGVAPAQLDLGLLFVLAIGAVTVLPIFIAGWSSNNKFALLGGMRAIAQSISYEVPLLLAALVPIVLTGSMDLSEIVRQQAEGRWLAVWPFFLGLPAFAIFLLAMLAESNRIPFDIPEAESELVAGVTTEYTGMKFALFYLAEYAHTLIASALAAALFLGGWDGPIAPGLHWLLLKTFVLFGFIYWVRWSLLRFRSDQLLSICWRWLVPAGVALVAGAGAWVAWGPTP